MEDTDRKTLVDTMICTPTVTVKVMAQHRRRFVDGMLLSYDALSLGVSLAY